MPQVDSSQGKGNMMVWGKPAWELGLTGGRAVMERLYDFVRSHPTQCLSYAAPRRVPVGVFWTIVKHGPSHRESHAPLFLTLVAVFSFSLPTSIFSCMQV